MLAWLIACSSGPAHPVVVIGVDGMEWSMVDRLVAEGRMPNVGGLIERGARGTVRATTPVMSPIIWTTMASGYPGEIHGIAGWTNGKGQAFDGSMVRSRRLWDVASAQGLSSLVVGWLMTFPASPIVGDMLSERFVWSYPMSKDPGDPLISFDRERHESMAFLAAPPSLEERAETLLPTEEWLESSPLAYQVELYGAPFHPLLRDELHVRVFEALWPEGDYKLGMVYLNGIDQVSHIYWPFADPSTAATIRRHPQMQHEQARIEQAESKGERTILGGQRPMTRAEVDSAARFVPDYYAYVDEAVGRILAVLDEDTVVVLCSDHGFQPGTLHPLVGGGHTRQAAVLIAGPGVDGELRSDGSVLDMAPTLAALLGIAPAEDWRGSPLIDVQPREAGPSWVLEDRAEMAVRAGAAGNPQLMGQLEALGYVDGEGKPILGVSRGNNEGQEYADELGADEGH